ncbi:MAG TPA: RodZ domain-containing protein [Thermoanaerobaculia bacterium]|jgi:cytoskeleton protein RodZ|nr:RodZ domain-containing protein [Thermoanaerobaculia bacterium]
MPDRDPQTQQSELASFGEELRREREIRGISLKEIADATKISKRFLEAIERNDHKTLPAPVFTRGFVREYARYLGLNAEEMVNRYNFGAVGDDRIEQSSHLDRLTTPQAPPLPGKKQQTRGIPPAYARVDRNVYILILVVVALSGVSYWALKHRRESRAAEERLAVETRVVPVPAPAPPVAPPQTASAVAQPGPNAPATLILSIEISERSWVILDADGKNVINDELRRGYHRTVEARDGFRFRTIGNAGGLALTLNDLPVPSLGHDGQVLHDVILDRTWLQKIQSPSQNTSQDQR